MSPHQGCGEAAEATRRQENDQYVMIKKKKERNYVQMKNLIESKGTNSYKHFQKLAMKGKRS